MTTPLSPIPNIMRLFAFFTGMLAILLGTGSCNISNTANQMSDHTQKPSATFLALGDSYTIGESVEASERWPVQLATQLNAAGVNVAAPQIIATTGWTTAELQQGIASAQAGLTPPYKLVSLLIGVNNQYRGYDIEIYKKEFQELLAQAIAFAGGDAKRVFVVSIPDYGVTPFAAGKDREKIARELDQYNALAQGYAQAKGVKFFDITPISRKPDPALIANDQLHPSGKMYQEWVALIYPHILKQLQEK